MKMLKSFLYLLIPIALLAACDQGQKSSANLQIQFDQNVFGTNPRANLKAVSQKISSSSADSGDWGLDDPTSLGDINCYALFVHGAEPEMQSSVCSNYNDTPLSFGPRAGFYPIAEAGNIQVLAGTSRTIYIVGMRAAAGVNCPTGFDANPDIESQNFSNPFIIGKTTVDLTSGDNTISIPISNSFTNVNKIKNCDFFDETFGNDLIVTPHESKRTYWIDDEVNSRKIEFSHNAESVQCSRDAGATYGSCDGDDHFIWNASDINVDQVIKATFADGSHKTYTMNPASHYPGLTIIPVGSCVGNFSGYDPSSGSLDPYLMNPSATYSNKYVCFNDGSEFDYAGGVISSNSGAVNNVFIAREGHSAKITSNSTSSGAILISGNGHKFIGLEISGNGTTGNPTVQIDNSGTLEIQDGIISNGNGASALKVSSGNAIITHSQVMGLDSTSEALFIYGASANATINHSSIRSQLKGLYVTNGGSATVDASEIVALGGSANAFELVDNATLTISNSKIIDNSGLGAHVHAANIATISSLTLNGNQFIRTSSNSGMLGHAIQATTGGGVNRIHSSSNDNLFCNEVSPGVPSFSGILTGTVTGTFVPTLNNNGASIGLCSQ